MRYIFVFVCFVIVSGCAHIEGSKVVDQGKPEALREMVKQENNEYTLSTLKVNGVTLENVNFDLPIVVNTQVEKWVDFFTGRGRRAFTRYLERSDYFIPYIEKILTEHQMPQDLVYLAMIESGFNNHARSHARAVGPWQFIRSTARIFGLKVDWWVDERKDISKSTLAAVAYLKRLHKMFGTWELATASYNAGEAKVSRAVRRYGSYDYWSLTRHRFLRPETRNYVPKLMAAAIIAKNRTQFGFEEKKVFPKGTPYEGEATEIAEILPEVLNGSKPKTLEGDLNRELSSEEVIVTPHVTKRGKVASEAVFEVDLHSPASLYQVAEASGMSYQLVKQLNPEILRWCTPPDSKFYKIKLPFSARNQFLENYDNSPRKTTFMRYKIRRGDTLSGIARRFGIRMTPIKQLNRLRRGQLLITGRWLILPLPKSRAKWHKKNKKASYYKRLSYQDREKARNKSKSIISKNQSVTQ